MLKHHLFNTLYGLIAALTVYTYQVEGNNQKATNQCAEYNNICDPRLPKPCCDINLSCKLKKSRNDFVCGEKVILGGSCGNDEDCSDINHAICSKDKHCTCISNNIRVNETYCAPALGSYCWKDEKCATDYSSCINNECQCEEHSIQQARQCSPKLLGSSCKSHSDCRTVKFAKCSVDKRCVCLLNTRAVNRTSCVPILNGFCLTELDCLVSNSECFDFNCECKSNFLTVSNTECREPRLGMTCRGFSDCGNFITHSICSDNKTCTCNDNHYAISSKACAPGFNEACFETEPCARKNSICIDNICQCKSNYAYQGTKCVPKFLEVLCETESDCQMIKFSTCSDDGVCVCKANYTKSNLSTCSPLIEGDCTKNDDCVAKNSYCLLNKCRCIENHFAHSNDLCTPTSLDKICQNYKDCENIPNSFCSRYEKCFCSSDYIAINGTRCELPLKQFCTQNKPCMIKNSICINNECQCKPNFVKYFNAECRPMVFDDICSEDSHCIDIGQKCSRNQTCICKDNYIALSSTKCTPLLNGYCSSSRDCYVKNSICVENRCQCDFDYFAHSNYECDPIMLGKQCSADIDCKNIKNSRCSSENICVCDVNYFAFDKFFCEPILNGFCSSDSDCYFDSFRCINNQCQCKSNYTAVSVNNCVETHLLSSCTDVTQCSDSWHSTCSLEGKCVCAFNNIAIGPSTCLPILNGYCWKDDQCMAENSVCIDFRCQCKPNFIAVANNLCVFSN